MDFEKLGEYEYTLGGTANSTSAVSSRVPVNNRIQRTKTFGNSDNTPTPDVSVMPVDTLNDKPTQTPDFTVPTSATTNTKVSRDVDTIIGSFSSSNNRLQDIQDRTLGLLNRDTAAEKQALREDLQISEKGERARKIANEITARYQTCLLYTSPSPRDRTRSRMPSSA